MSGTLKEYDPREVIIEWGGINLNEGIAEGTFITVSRNVRAWALNVGGDGGGTRVRSHNRSGVVEVTLRRGSATHNKLSDRAKEDENGTSHVESLLIRDFSGETKHDAPQAFLDGPPDDEFGTDEGNAVWRLLCLDLNMDPRGNKDA